MKLHKVCLCFNACVLTNVYFGGGIVNFKRKQCEELKKIHELLTIWKIRLSDKLPRKLLCVKNEL